MNPYAIIIGALLFVTGWYLGRETTIRMCRRLYKLDVDFDMIFIEQAEKDEMFNKNIEHRITNLRQIK